MSLESDGDSRLDVLSDELTRWISGQPSQTRYALLVAEYRGEVDLRLPYPATADQVRAEIDTLEPWGVIDLGTALERAARIAASIAHAQSEPTTRLVLVTDAEDLAGVTGGTRLRLPQNLDLITIVPDGSSQATMRGILDSLVARAPVTAPDRAAAPREPSSEAAAPPSESPRRTATETAPTRTAAAGSDNHDQRAASDRTSVRADSTGVRTAAVSGSRRGSGSGSENGLLARWAAIARWVFLAAVLIGAGAVAKGVARHNRRVERVREHNAQPPTILIEIRGPSGRRETEISSYPITIGGGKPTIHHDLGEIDQSFTLALVDRKIVVTSEAKIKINGVGRTEHELSDRDQIRIGAVRCIVKAIDRVKPVRIPRPHHALYPVAPAAAAVTAIAAFLIGPPISGGAPPTQEPPVPSSSRSAREPHVAHESSLPPREQPSAPPDYTSEERSTPDPSSGAPSEPGNPFGPDTPAESPPGASPAEAGYFVATGPDRRATPTLSLPAVIDPDEPIPPRDLDYLLIHAHPDDEALDFGALIARLSAAGRVGAVMLLTDGSSGRDQYPWRETGDGYPPRDLSGNELAGTRVAEARESIGWLGSKLYLRLGLPNYPYNSLDEELSADEVLSLWGGREKLVTRVAAAIARLRPDVVLSPDVPGPAYEHFEHEAVGILVEEALSRLRATNEHVVHAHIVSLDPLQLEGYRDVLKVSPWTPAADGSIPRLRQLYALRAHRTQRDATVIGVETRMALSHDYFIVKHKSTGFDLGSALRHAGIDLAAGAP
jgi:LmbE family N-acetylglucosaminyl deacetylase